MPTSMRCPQELVTLSSYLRKLPGVGMRTSERFAFAFLHWSPGELKEFADLIADLQEKLPACPQCGCLTERGTCLFCTQQRRQSAQLCLVATSRDPFAIEATGSYRGLYHVIEHLLSPLDNRHIDTLRLDRIKERISAEGIRELIIAFDSTLEGDTTALYLKQELTQPNLNIFRLAFGLPVGMSLESIDSGSLARALSGRQMF